MDFLVHPAPAVKSQFQNMFFTTLKVQGKNKFQKHLLECCWDFQVGLGRWFGQVVQSGPENDSGKNR